METWQLDRMGKNNCRWGAQGRATIGLCLLSFLVGCQSSSTGYNMEGVQLFQQGQTQAAVDRFQQAITADPRDAEGYYNLAAAYHQAGKQARDSKSLEYAERVYHQCLDLSPDHVDCHRGLAVLLVETGRSDKAFTLLERWVQRSPRVAEARIELARLYEEYGDQTLAERYLTEAVGLEATNARAWTALASLRERKGQYAQALANYQQAYQLNRNHPALAARIAQLQQQTTRR